MTTDEFKDIPVFPLEGAGAWEATYEWGKQLDKTFPDNDAEDFTSACLYNDPGPTAEHKITRLAMTQQGERDGEYWVWLVVLDNGETWEATGGCDYTGWDCQSGLGWKKL